MKSQGVKQLMAGGGVILLGLKVVPLLSGLGAIGLLIIGILSSVYPAVIYDPPQGEVRAIVATGFTAFLKLHNITWLFILCCALVICGVVIMLLNTRKKGT